MLKRFKYPVSTLLSIPIACYWSIKRLATESLSSFKIDRFIKSIGII